MKVNHVGIHKVIAMCSIVSKGKYYVRHPKASVLLFGLSCSKNTFVIAFSVGAIMNVIASLLMGIYVLLELLVSTGCSVSHALFTLANYNLIT